MEVQILSKKFIKPSPPTPALQNIRISFIDQLAPLSHVACIFYYPIPDQSASKAITTQLEKSFSKTLTLFYPLAGRYAKEDLSVECNHEGGAFWVAQVSGELASVVNGGGDPKLFRRFLPLGVGEVDEGTTPLVGVQVSVFRCGGLAVGVLLSHRIADAYTVATFIDAWAKVGRGGIGEVVGPSFELGSIIPARISPELNAPPSSRRKTSKIVTRRFVFDAASIASLKAKAGCHATRLEAVSALIWKALIAVSAKRGCLRPSLLVHSVNLRGKTGLPIPEIACGNFYMLATARFWPGKSKMELADLAGLVGEAIRSRLARCAKAQNEEDLFHEVTKCFGEAYEEWTNEEVDTYMFASWCRFPFYEADFGWGKPSWVSRRDFGAELVSLVDTKCGSGIEAWVGLDEQHMLKFQQHQDIVAFTHSPVEQLKREC